MLEFAAGTGLPGLTAAHFARSVVLTDFRPDIVANLRYNIGLNRNANTGRGGRDYDAYTVAVAVVTLVPCVAQYVWLCPCR